MEILDGSLRPGDKIVSANTPTSVYEVLEVGIMSPDQQKTKGLFAGQVGYVICGMRQRAEARVGDTFHTKGEPVKALPGFQPAKPMVFAGLFPVEQVSLSIFIIKFPMHIVHSFHTFWYVVIVILCCWLF